MKKCKYDVLVSVCWRDIKKSLEWCLAVRKNDAYSKIDRVKSDQIHNYPEFLERDLFSAIFACECVFYQFELLMSLRSFLRYKFKDQEDYGLSDIYSFYIIHKENPRSEDLTAQHYEDLDQ